MRCARSLFQLVSTLSKLMFKKSMRYILVLIFCVIIGTPAVQVYAWEIDKTTSITSVIDGDTFCARAESDRMAGNTSVEYGSSHDI